jgi:hypothetical protein
MELNNTCALLKTELKQGLNVSEGLRKSILDFISVIYTFSFRLFRIILLNKTALIILKGQSHEKFGEMRVWGLSLRP